MSKSILLVAAITLTGCSNVSEIGRIGDTVYFGVYSFEIFGPSHNSLVSLKDGQTTPKVEASFSDEGIAGDIISNSGQALQSIKNDNENSNVINNAVNAESNSESNSESKSNSKSNSKGKDKTKQNRSGGKDGTNPGGGGNQNGTKNPGKKK